MNERTSEETAWNEAEDEAAALWVARHLDREVDARAFALWLDGDPGRAARFDALWASCMDKAVTLGLRAQASDPGSFARLAAEVANDDDAPAVHRRLGTRLAFTACAALVAGACVLAWPQVRFWMTPEQTYATRPGQILRVALADGSHIVLNGRSRLSVRLAQDRRVVRLEAGEALFDVSHDAARPFSVASAEGTVNVLGTRFDLARNADSLDLVVERGLVRFEGNQPGVNAVNVAAAHRASLVDGRIGPPERITGQDPEGDWREGWLQVSDMPLGALVARLQRWSAKPIEVEDPALLRVRVAGRLRLDQPAQVLENLSVLHGFAVRTTSRAYVLDRP